MCGLCFLTLPFIPLINPLLLQESSLPLISTHQKNKRLAMCQRRRHTISVVLLCFF
jgi:hypothetical protein